jgi:CRP-like cAMP-binding protein
MVAVFGTGDFFGERCLSGQVRRLATVSAITECETTRIPKEKIIEVIHNEPTFAELFISHLLARTSRVEADLVDQLFNSSERRLAGPSCFLLILARKVTLSQSSQELANRRLQRWSAPRDLALVSS